MNEEQIRCPQCGSSQIHADKKGFSVGKAAAGAIVGGIYVGALTGGIGRNKIEITCLHCGYKFKPGEQLKETVPIEMQFEQGYVKPIKKEEIEIAKTYKCHYCQKISSTPEKYCPACGSRYKEEDLYKDESVPKGGCFGVILVLITLASGTILIF